MHQVDGDISHLLGKFLVSCNGSQNYAPCELFAIARCLCANLNIFIFHIQGLQWWEPNVDAGKLYRRTGSGNFLSGKDCD
jgi:hypothetical protein